MKRILPIAILVTIGLVSVIWWVTHREHTREHLALYGNVDLRQIQLSFNGTERIAAVLVQEGNQVTQGQVLARLDVSRLQPQVSQAEAELLAQQQVVARLHTGNRPEEIAQARANVAAALADATQAQSQFGRIKELFEKSAGRAVSRQDLDQATAAADAANAKLLVAKRSLDLMVAGPRKEEVAEAEARLRADEAKLTLSRQLLKDAELIAPTNSVVRTRILEPGDMASPQRPVFSLAIMDPKWVRAYVAEPDLGLVHPNMAAAVSVDSFPARTFSGWVGFISPVAEFTPKAVQTEELRSSLVYEIRIFVNDPHDELRLGMPATVRLQIQAGQPNALANARTAAGN